ncbi:MAG: DUF3592 domain-containing protein, partial [Chloroflexota bacterium]
MIIWTTVIVTFAVISLTLIALGWRLLAGRQAAGQQSPAWSTPSPAPTPISTRPRPRARPDLIGNGCTLLFGLGWTVFSLIFVIISFAIFIPEWRTASLLNETGVTTEAVVIDRRIVPDSEGDTYYITYQYSAPLPQGEQRLQYSNEESVSRQIYDDQPIESRVTIRYAANQPEVARLAGRSRTIDVMVLAFLALFGGLFVLVGLWQIYSSWQGIRHSTALARQGVLTTARLTERWLEKDSEGGNSYCVAFRFDP